MQCKNAAAHASHATAVDISELSSDVLSTMKIPVAVSIAVVALTCITSAFGAGGQVVDHGKVVEDPQLDYRKYSKEIAASDAAERSRQAEAVTSAQQSVVQDEIAFRASLAAVTQSLNAAAPADGVPVADAASAAGPGPAPADAPHGLSMGVAIAVAAAVIAALLVIGLALSPKRRHHKSRRQLPQEESVRLVDFARKSDRDGTGN